MNRTQKLLEVARWVYRQHEWRAGSDGRIYAAPNWDVLSEFNLSDRKTRQDTLMKLREHGWFVEERKGYWLGLKVDETGRTEIKRDTFEDLVWDLVGRVG